MMFLGSASADDGPKRAGSAVFQLDRLAGLATPVPPIDGLRGVEGIECSWGCSVMAQEAQSTRKTGNVARHSVICVLLRCDGQGGRSVILVTSWCLHLVLSESRIIPCRCR